MRSDVRAKTVRLDVEGDTELLAECSVCLSERPVHEVTEDGQPVCFACWEYGHSERCAHCDSAISDERAKASTMCPSCEADADDADMAAIERGSR